MTPGQPVSADAPSEIAVLLVEDNDGDARLICHTLLTVPQIAYQIVHEEKLAPALKRLAMGEEFDVLLLDLSLPDNAGIDTLLAAREVNDLLPIVILTGTDDDALARACIESGAQDYLPKHEISPILLNRVIGYALSRMREAHLREAQIRDLQRALHHYQSISSAARTTGVAAMLSGNASLQERDPDAFSALHAEYATLLEMFMDHLVLAKDKPTRSMERLATTMGNLAAGPRDLIDIHLAALERATTGATEGRTRFLAVEGRLMALEMMGRLVDYYRVGIRRS